MSYIIFTYDISLLEDLFHAAAIQSTESPQWTTKPHLLTVVDMYATDDLGLILLLWRPNL